MKRILLLVGMIIIMPLHVYALSLFDGDEGNEKDLEKYVKKHIDVYDIAVELLETNQERRDTLRMRRELERLVLKMDAGDIKDDDLRKKVIRLRRAAMKNRNKGEYMINNFERLTRNRLGGSVGAVFDGKVDTVSPWLDYSLENEKKRIGKKLLHMWFDVSQGNVAFYHDIERYRICERYDSFSLKVRGTVKGCSLQLTNDTGVLHEYILEDITAEWQTFVIPFRNLSDSETLDFSKINRILFFVNEYLALTDTGSLYFDDFALRITDKKKSVHEKRHGYAYEVEGAVPLGTNKSFMQ